MASDAFTWTGRVSAGSVGTLGPLRLIRGLEATRTEDTIWVRGPRLKRADEEAVRRVPWEARYELLDGGRLRLVDRLLPEGALPGGSWTTLSEFLRVRLPSQSSPGATPRGVAIELRSATIPREPNIIEATRQDWLTYVETAPEFRLQRLVFAVDERNPESVLIRGVPLPPLPGAHFVEAERVAIPAGYQWWPAVTAGSIRRSLACGENELVILRLDGTCALIPRSAWMSAARSTIRLMLAPETYAR
ncbi:hypothetical protein ACXR0O_16315 [Verrucomicrobiota bacterium sgz303538]